MLLRLRFFLIFYILFGFGLELFSQGLDTCWNIGQKIVHGDRDVGDFFGSTVAIDSNWAFASSLDDLGSNQNAGAVYVYSKDTNWAQVQKIVPNYRSAGEVFGSKIAVDGDKLMVCNDVGSGDTLKLYYFQLNGSNVWEQQQIITNGFTNKSATSIDIEDGYTYVGISRQGKVLVYGLSGNTWSLDQTIIGSSGNRFGVSVAVEDDLLAVGAFWDDFDENGQNNVNKAGSVKLYARNGSNPWSLDSKAVSPNREANGYFGWDVELMNGELYVGSYTTDYQGLNQAGAVYRLAYDTSWANIQTISPEEYFSGGIFGYAIDTDDDRLVVGHRRHSGLVNGNTLTWEGASHLFILNDSNEMEEIETFYSTNRNGGDEFGLDVALYGASAIIGSFFDQTDENNGNAVPQAGAAHLFDGDCDSTSINFIHDTTEIVLCSGDSVYAAGAWQSTLGQYTDTIAIDTILITNVSVSAAINIMDIVVICDGDSVMVHDEMVGQTGIYTDSAQTVSGCDSISTIIVTEGATSYQFELAWLYDGDSILLGGTYQTLPNIYVDTFTTNGGCDSIIETLLWVYPVQNGIDSLTICQGDSVELGGILRSTAGTYSDTSILGGTAFINQVALSVNQAIFSNSNMFIAIGDSVFLFGTWRYTSGTYCDTIGGCDSVICTQLDVDSLSYMTITDSTEICTGDSLLVGNSYYYFNAIYSDTVGNGFGVDTIYMTTLSVDPFNSVNLIFSSGLWLKSNQVNPPFMWFDCDSQSVIATTQIGSYQPGYSGNFAVINQSSICGDTSNCVFHSNTQNKGQLEVRGYPAGARDYYTLMFSFVQIDAQIDLYDLQGQLVYSWSEAEVKQVTLPLSDVAAGVYLLRIYAKKGTATLKFVKLVH